MVSGEDIDIGCHGKENFASWKKAQFALKKTVHSSGHCHDKRKMSVYHCKSCQGIHIGGSDNPAKSR